MALKKILECDKCGASVDVPNDCETLIAAIAAANGATPGWERASGDKVLCPKCSPLYDQLLKKQEKEIEKFFK